MSELALITKKGTKSFDNLEYFLMHWTKLASDVPIMYCSPGVPN